LDSYRFHHSRHAWEQDRRRDREARARGDELRRYTWARRIRGSGADAGRAADPAPCRLVVLWWRAMLPQGPLGRRARVEAPEERGRRAGGVQAAGDDLVEQRRELRVLPQAFLQAAAQPEG